MATIIIKSTRWIDPLILEAAIAATLTAAVSVREAVNLKARVNSRSDAIHLKRAHF